VAAAWSEHKIAKVIELLEELRRDGPQVQNLVGPAGAANGRAGGRWIGPRGGSRKGSFVRPPRREQTSNFHVPGGQV
jgi:hypothetical protein